jgi:ribosomal-protein-alanine N-acetyltransferase
MDGKPIGASPRASSAGSNWRGTCSRSPTLDPAHANGGDCAALGRHAKLRPVTAMKEEQSRGQVFETERLLLRAWRMEDADAAFAIYGDPEVVRFLGDGRTVADLAAQRAWLAERIVRHERFQAKGFGGWAIVERESGRVVGTALLKPLPPEDQDIEVGWHLTRRAWGRGYASEAGMALLWYGFTVRELDRIHAVVQPENARSAAVALRLGMRHLGRTTKYYDGELLELFAIDRGDFIEKGT